MSSKLFAPKKLRDAERSRTAILDAAEELFAQKGFDGVSFAEIGVRAGVSRGTPGYFFGSKEELYKAVLDRVFGVALRDISKAAERAAATNNPREVIAAGVEGYMDFIAANPNFVQLVERESLGSGKVLAQNPVHVRALQVGTSSTAQYLPPNVVASVDLRQLMISIMGLCWFPLAHARTLLPALGLDPNDPEFLQSRKRHVVELLCRAFLKEE